MSTVYRDNLGNAFIHHGLGRMTPATHGLGACSIGCPACPAGCAPLPGGGPGVPGVPPGELGRVSDMSDAVADTTAEGTKGKKEKKCKPPCPAYMWCDDGTCMPGGLTKSSACKYVRKFGGCEYCCPSSGGEVCTSVSTGKCSSRTTGNLATLSTSSFDGDQPARRPQMLIGQDQFGNRYQDTGMGWVPLGQAAPTPTAPTAPSAPPSRADTGGFFIPILMLFGIAYVASEVLGGGKLKT